MSALRNAGPDSFALAHRRPPASEKSSEWTALVVLALVLGGTAYSMRRR